MELEPRVERPLLIVFADLTRFQMNARRLNDTLLAELLASFYAFAATEVAAARGRIVKFMGDAFLAIWEEADASAGAASLPALKERIDAFWSERGWDSKVVVKAHFGRAVAGSFGDHFDVIGNEVNTAATLPARTVTLSAQAFRRLSELDRRAFQKHTAHVVYIPTGDPRP